MSQTWIISDTHFLHARIETYCFRPYTWAELVLANWKALVGPEDTVYHLGDLCFVNSKTKETFRKMVRDLPGTKVLIKGNHDRQSRAYYDACGFILMKQDDDCTIGACGEKLYDSTYVLSHKPIDLSPYNPNTVNIHGHFHNVAPDRWEADLKALLTPNHYLFSLEEIGYKPITLTEALKPGILINTLERSQKGNAT